jgi:hypothetical protein
VLPASCLQLDECWRSVTRHWQNVFRFLSLWWWWTNQGWMDHNVLPEMGNPFSAGQELVVLPPQSDGEIVTWPSLFLGHHHSSDAACDVWLEIMVQGSTPTTFTGRSEGVPGDLKQLGRH